MQPALTALYTCLAQAACPLIPATVMPKDCSPCPLLNSPFPPQEFSPKRGLRA